MSSSEQLNLKKLIANVGIGDVSAIQTLCSIEQNAKNIEKIHFLFKNGIVNACPGGGGVARVIHELEAKVLRVGAPRVQGVLRGSEGEPLVHGTEKGVTRLEPSAR